MAMDREKKDAEALEDVIWHHILVDNNLTIASFLVGLALGNAERLLFLPLVGEY